MASALRIALRVRGRGDVTVDEWTLERQCEPGFVDLLASTIHGYDAVCSLGCGAGVQMLAERFSRLPIYPGLNTLFMGVLSSPGVWLERCSGCGSCRLGYYGGVCPLTRCAKRMLNGPCGGAQGSRCEAHPERACAWHAIYERAKILGTLDQLLRGLAPPQDWSRSMNASPRAVVRADQQLPRAADGTTPESGGLVDPELA